MVMIPPCAGPWSLLNGARNSVDKANPLGKHSAHASTFARMVASAAVCFSASPPWFVPGPEQAPIAIISARAGKKRTFRIFNPSRHLVHKLPLRPDRHVDLLNGLLLR